MFLYWIHHKDHNDIKTQGYVGISSNFLKRIKTHLKNPKNKHLKNALKKYQNDIIFDIILEENKDFCLFLEEELRPEKNIGWNIAKGGGVPPSRKGTTFIMSEKHKNNIKNSRKGNFRTGIKLKKETKDKIAFSNAISKGRKYLIKDPNGNQIEIINLNKYCRENNLHASNMLNIKFRKQGHYKGYTCTRIL